MASAEDLYQAHAVAVRAYALRRSSPADADDACAEVWAIVCRRPERVPEDAAPWLFGTARRVLANQRRGHRRLAALRERMARDVPADIDPPAIPGDHALAAALAALSPSDRELLMLIAWEELTPAQAAAALGLRTGTLAVRLHRARTRLSAELAGRPDSSHRTLTAAEAP
ncbi:sigma-70 family RNA polymerase sigma factor [Paraconexibacter sp. AEG42_29]|uniref:RNA polymerase sigma factor n=1 Tax=Paraconexibacter sp. AEG42_29 TaxID=2997339 RepID=UPI00339D6E68